MVSSKPNWTVYILQCIAMHDLDQFWKYRILKESAILSSGYFVFLEFVKNFNWRVCTDTRNWHLVYFSAFLAFGNLIKQEFQFKILYWHQKLDALSVLTHFWCIQWKSSFHLKTVNFANIQNHLDQSMLLSKVFSLQ